MMVFEQVTIPLQSFKGVCDMSDQYKTLAYTFATMLNTQNIALIDTFIATDYLNHNPYVADGREANKQFWSQWLTAFPDTQVTVEDVLVVEHNVIGRFTYRATHQGYFMGVSPTGNPITMRSIDIWRVQDGKFVEHWDELNTLELFQQIGAISTF